MNKEVIYLEPEDDITDILTKLQQAEQKLVALVPPKKATTMRSAVNMKLVARVAKECEKIVVIVTADPAIVKMAIAARIPVAKTLHSRPVIPTEANVRAAEADVQMIDEDGEDITEKTAKNRENASKIASEDADFDSDERLGKSADTLELTDDGLENGSQTAKKPKLVAKKPKNPAGPKVGFAKYRKWLFIGIPSVIVLTIALVWAFVFAPSATITVGISSTASNFSETVRFTTDPAAENIAEGVFFAEKQSIEQSYTADFNLDSISEENKGTKATGKITASASFVPIEYADQAFMVSVDEGDRLTTRDGLVYIATSSASTGWDGKSTTIVCDNGTLSGLAAMKRSCRLSVTVSVEAVEAGEKYNLSAGSAWNEYQGLSISNGSPISGGTTNMVKVISQEAVDKVRDSVVADPSSNQDGETMLSDDLSNDLVIIKSSFKSEAGDVSSTPAVGEEVKDDARPSVKVTVIFSVYTVERSKIKEYIDSKTTLSDDQQIYSIGEPYFERFIAIDEPARLKTDIETGPIVSEEAIFEKAAGRKTGEVQSLLRSINGVSSVEIRTSYFWVWSIPTDRNKVTINISLENE